jgi:hypothetical protein
MKENEMKENAKTEEQLLEEQLQAVTGGCGDCINYNLTATRLLHRSAQQEALSLQPGLLPSNAQSFRNDAASLHRDAQGLLNRVAARHPVIDDPDVNLPDSFVVRPPDPR